MVTDVLTLALLSSQIELIMEAIHKTRNLQYNKTMEVKQTCCSFLLYGLTLLTHTQSAGAVLNMRVFLCCNSCRHYIKSCSRGRPSHLSLHSVL